MMETLKSLGSSKKALSALAAVIAIVLVRYMGLDDAQATEIGREIVGVAAALLVGQGAADFGKVGKSDEATAIVTMAAMEARAGFTGSVEDDADN